MHDVISGNEAHIEKNNKLNIRQENSREIH